MINYFNFKKFNDRFILTNDTGRYMFATFDELASLVKNRVDYHSDFGKKAVEKFFCYDGSPQAFSEILKPYYRESKNYLFSATSLNIFVVTNACNMNCVYCQAQSGSCVPDGMMTKEIAEKAVDIALSSPETYLSFEFQGGEPLLNFGVIKHIVEYTERKNKDKVIEYNIVSNLTLLTREIAEFIKAHNIGVSTSIDGDGALHNRNRSYRAGGGTFSDVLKGTELLKEYEIEYGAIQTTTKSSLSQAKSIVDTYVELGLKSVFIRNLTPLGCANNSWEEIGYTPESFVKFYKQCFDYIIEINKNGIFLKEGHASIMLSKILSGTPVNYMELRSPCGAGVGQIAYYYDGNIYTCDEGRMLAEMGDDSFKLGTVDNSYDELMNCNTCKAACIASTLEALPNCCDCVYNPYCGTCPVVNLALSKDICSKEPDDYKCKVYKGIFDILFEALQDPEKYDIMKTWI